MPCLRVPEGVRNSFPYNGCSRPYAAELGFSGRAPGHHNVYLGGGFHVERLNRLYLENVDEAAEARAFNGPARHAGVHRSP